MELLFSLKVKVLFLELIESVGSRRRGVRVRCLGEEVWQKGKGVRRS